MTTVHCLPRQARGASPPASRRASAIDCPAGTNPPEPGSAPADSQIRQRHAQGNPPPGERADDGPTRQASATRSAQHLPRYVRCRPECRRGDHQENI